VAASVTRRRTRAQPLGGAGACGSGTASGSMKPSRWRSSAPIGMPTSSSGGNSSSGMMASQAIEMTATLLTT
jgi:hypothetical protein